MNSAYLFLIGSMVCLGVSTIFFEKSTPGLFVNWYWIGCTEIQLLTRNGRRSPAHRLHIQ